MKESTQSPAISELIAAMKDEQEKQRRFEQRWLALARQGCPVCGYTWKPRVKPMRLIVCEHQKREIAAKALPRPRVDVAAFGFGSAMLGIEIIVDGEGVI